MNSSFYKGAVIGAISAILVLAGTSAIAGTGVGRVFNLGKTNTVSKTTKLRGKTAKAQLDVTNSGKGAGVVGRLSSKKPAKTFAAVQGVSASTSDRGFGVLGSQAGSGIGVFGSTPLGTGVAGNHTSATGTGPGVKGVTNSAAGAGVDGTGPGVGVNGSSAAIGVNGTATAATGIGVKGTGTASGVNGSSAAIGVDGTATAATGIGVRGTGSASGISGSSAATGVNGTATGTTGTGVKGTAPAVGVNGTATGTGGTGVSANGGSTGLAATGTSFGVAANVSTAGAVGVRSTADATANDAVQGITANAVGDAVQGTASGTAAFGLFAITTGGGAGVVSSSSTGVGVSASNGSATNPTVTASNGTGAGIAGRFTGDTALNVEANDTFGTGLNATIIGDTDSNGTANDDGNTAISASSDDVNSDATISASTASGSTELLHEAIETFGFVDVNGNARVTGNLDVVGTCCALLDNPLDPANSYLRHASVGSPDLKNMYDGTVTTNGSGRATVELPNYFGALNKDFRYQLTIVGAVFAQAIVSREIPAGGRSFEIRTSKPNVKVSWQVTGIRKDAYANAHPMKVIDRKTGEAAGMFLYPELYGHAGERPLGLDLPSTPTSSTPAARRAEADLTALIRRKAEQARRDARR